MGFSGIFPTGGFICSLMLAKVPSGSFDGTFVQMMWFGGQDMWVCDR
jgi:hypothetical protein